MPRSLLVLLTLLAASAPAVPGAQLKLRGLRSIPTEEALNQIRGRAKFIADRPAIPSRADDAAFLLEQLLRGRGLPDAAVTWSIPPNQDLIILEVDEGAVSFLGDVRIEGAETPEQTELLAQQFRSAHIRGGQAQGRKIPYQPSLDAQGVSNINDYLNSVGYWDATVELKGTKRNASTNEVSADVVVRPGPLHKLATPAINSTQTVDTQLLELLGSVAGQVADTETIKKTRKSVEDHYREHGYQYADVRMNATHNAGVTQLTFTVDPGRQFRVGNITLKGVEDTEPGRISRRFDRFHGQYYDVDAVNRQVNRLYGTGAFKSLQFVEHPREDGYLDLTLHVDEGKPTGYYLYGGAGSYEGFILGAGYYHRNLFNRLYSFRAQAEYTGIGLLGDVQLSNPFFLERDLTATTRLYILTRQREGYDKTELGLNFSLDWRVNDHYRLEGHFNNAIAVITSTGIPDEELGPTEYGVHVLGVTQSFDFREAAVANSEGFLGRLTTDLGFTLGEASVGFLRAEGQGTYYWPWTDKNHFSFGLRGGTMIPSTSQELPIDLRYFTGGANSVRSFPEREMGPQARNGDPRGGEAYWVANAEYIRGIKGPIKGVLFFDAGSLAEEHGKLFTTDIELAVGLGLRINLPIGPVRFEYGYNLTEDGNEDSGAFHFAIGSAF